MFTADIGSIIGISAGILMFGSYLIYVIDILRGNTKPNRATWLMLAAISLIISISYYDLGAQDTWWVSLGATLGVSLVALLSIKYGTGGRSRFDRTCILVAVVSIGIYLLSGNPLVTLLFTLLMDGAAMLPTIRHAYLTPGEESRFAWTLTIIADLLTIAVIDQWTLEIAFYPIYMSIINGVVVYLLYTQRTKTRRHLFSLYRLCQNRKYQTCCNHKKALH